MSAARRVRVARTNMDQIGRIPRAVPVLIVERLRVASKCANRPNIYEWRLAFGRTSEVIVGEVRR